MRRIRILPESLQDKIAAGEVIERPASVVKELLENSLDAGATEIHIEVLGSGKRLIKVADNGSGILRDDLELCFLRYATSKILSEEDLYKIKTLGFRGEALSSIASVSKMRITSQAEAEEVGGFIELSAGKLLNKGPATCRGTVVEVRDLFFNTPARKKFLKSDKTELYHIISTITEISLAHPGVSFLLLVDRQETLNLPKAKDLKERLQQVYGNETIEGLIEVFKGTLHMFISKEGHFHSTRVNQHVFINRRPVRDPIIKNAIYRGYGILLPADKHPEFFVYLYLSPEDVDFNVHPTKREVRFRDRESIYRRIYFTVKDLLQKEEPTGVRESRREKTTPVEVKSTYKESPETPYEQIAIRETEESFDTKKKFLLIGEVFFAYSEGKGITIVDYHAAHERILYERLKKTDNTASVQLLFPKQIRLPEKEFRILSDHLSTLKELGIEAEVFGEKTLLIRALPQFLQDVRIENILTDLAHVLMEVAASCPVEELRDRLAKTIACHKAVRGKTQLDELEMRRLLDELKEMEDPNHCPHGRPTRIHFDIPHLRKLFRR
jgi:DNA mismatch repair protein MutL